MLEILYLTVESKLFPPMLLPATDAASSPTTQALASCQLPSTNADLHHKFCTLAFSSGAAICLPFSDAASCHRRYNFHIPSQGLPSVPDYLHFHLPRGYCLLQQSNILSHSLEPYSLIHVPGATNAGSGS